MGWFLLARPRAPAEAAGSINAPPVLDINREFDDGRRQIIDGRYPAARATFARLASQTKNNQPIYDWALLNQAVAALLDQQESLTRQALHEVENAGTGNFSDASLGAFLRDTAKLANLHSTVALSDVPDHAAKPFALFLLGLTDVQLGRFNDAEALLKAFVASQPPQSLAWISEYKPIARKYLADSQAILAWREQHRSAKSMTELRNALSSLQDLIAQLQKNTAISAEALLAQKTLVARLRDTEMPRWNAALQSYRRLAAIYDFTGAASAIRKVKVTEPSLRETQRNCQNVADWLAQWKATLINDLNTHGYTGVVVMSDTEYNGIAGATAGKLKMRVPYGIAEIQWLKVPAPTLVTVSSSFATDADRQWRCGVFAWAFGQTNAARQLFDAACSAKPSYKEARKFFDQTKP